MEWIKDAIQDMTDGITEGISEFIFKFIFAWFYQPLLLFIDLLDKVLIEPSNITSIYISNASILINSLITAIALCVFGFKIVQVMKRNAEGNAESPMYYVAQLLPASALVAILPWLVDIMTRISYSATRAFMSVGEQSYLATIKSWKDFDGAQSSISDMFANISIYASSAFVMLIFIATLLIFTVIFMFQFVSRIADLVVMKLVAPLIAVSMLADQNNYLDVWWRELLAISIQLPLQMFTFFAGLNLIFGAKVEIPTLLLGFGMLIITVKSPSFIRSMAYSTGSGRMASMASMSATRMVAQKIFMR